MKCIESIHPHIEDYFLYQGHYIIPEGFSVRVSGNSIIVIQKHQFKVGEYVHSISEGLPDGHRVALGVVSDFCGDNCMVFDGYATGYDWHPERLVVNTMFSKPAESWEIEMHEGAIRSYNNDNVEKKGE